MLRIVVLLTFLYVQCTGESVQIGYIASSQTVQVANGTHVLHSRGADMQLYCAVQGNNSFKFVSHIVQYLVNLLFVKMTTDYKSA